MDEKSLRERQTNLLNLIGIKTDSILKMLEPLESGIDRHEEDKLKERDEKAMAVECLHHNVFTHTNGSIQCLRCKRMLKVIEPKWRK